MTTYDRNSIRWNDLPVEVRDAFDTIADFIDYENTAGYYISTGGQHVFDRLMCVECEQGFPTDTRLQICDECFSTRDRG